MFSQIKSQTKRVSLMNDDGTPQKKIKKSQDVEDKQDEFSLVDKIQSFDAKKEMDSLPNDAKELLKLLIVEQRKTNFIATCRTVDQQTAHSQNMKLRKNKGMKEFMSTYEYEQKMMEHKINQLSIVRTPEMRLAIVRSLDKIHNAYRYNRGFKIKVPSFMTWILSVFVRTYPYFEVRHENGSRLTPLSTIYFPTIQASITYDINYLLKDGEHILVQLVSLFLNRNLSHVHNTIILFELITANTGRIDYFPLLYFFNDRITLIQNITFPDHDSWNREVSIYSKIMLEMKNAKLPLLYEEVIKCLDANIPTPDIYRIIVDQYLGWSKKPVFKEYPPCYFMDMPSTAKTTAITNDSTDTDDNSENLE